MGESTAVVKIESFGIVKSASSEALSAVQEALGGRQLTSSDLDRIKIPAGGGKAFDMPSVTGEESSAKEFYGIITLVTGPRAYWKNKFSGANTPPDCSSTDGVIGNYTHSADGKDVQCSRRCEGCPFAQWGSAIDEKGQPGPGQACKAMKFLFVHRQEDAVLPVIVVLPPSSVKVLEKYLLRLATRGVPPFGVITKFTLEPAQSKSGIKYSRINLAAAGLVDADKLANLRGITTTYRSTFTNITIEADDYEVSESDEKASV